MNQSTAELSALYCNEPEGPRVFQHPGPSGYVAQGEGGITARRIESILKSLLECNQETSTRLQRLEDAVQALTEVLASNGFDSDEDDEMDAEDHRGTPIKAKRIKVNPITPRPGTDDKGQSGGWG